jgi:hypothetical protein
MDIAHTHVQSLGEAESVWFKLGLLTNETHPMQVLMRLSDRYGGCVPINIKDDRIFFISDVDGIRTSINTGNISTACARSSATA